MSGLRLGLVVAAAWLVLVPVAAGGGDDAGKRLEEVERALGRSREAQRELQLRAVDLDQETAGLRRRLVAAAKDIQDHEAKVSRLESELDRLSVTETVKLRRLKTQRGRFARVLMAVQRLASHPPEALIAQPLSPSDTVRGAILLRAAVPEIERRAGRLRGELDELAWARDEMTARRAELAAAAGALNQLRARLDKLLAEKNRLRRRTAAEERKAGRRVEELALKAEDLRDLMVRLEKDRLEQEKKNRQAATKSRLPPPPPGLSAPISKARGRLPYPAVGRLVGAYGQATATGLTRKGIDIATRPGAQVVATYDGRVVFAGAFRGYGQLLIIEHGEGYHSLLAGLARIDGVVGQWVLGGEPVGVMGRPDSGNPTLYVELRRNGQPINPLPWLAARKGKVSG